MQKKLRWSTIVNYQIATQGKIIAKQACRFEKEKLSYGNTYHELWNWSVELRHGKVCREKTIKVVQYFQSVFPPSASFWELPLKLVENTHQDYIWIVKSFIWKGQSKIMGIVFLKALLCYFVNHTISKILTLNKVLACSKRISHLSVIPLLIRRVVRGGGVFITCSFILDLKHGEGIMLSN